MSEKIKNFLLTLPKIESYVYLRKAAPYAYIIPNDMKKDNGSYHHLMVIENSIYNFQLCDSIKIALLEYDIDYKPYVRVYNLFFKSNIITHCRHGSARFMGPFTETITYLDDIDNILDIEKIPKSNYILSFLGRRLELIFNKDLYIKIINIYVLKDLAKIIYSYL